MYRPGDPFKGTSGKPDSSSGMTCPHCGRRIVALKKDAKGNKICPSCGKIIQEAGR